MATTAEPPHRLWHYTDQRGFLGILESGALWASKVQYQNDQREFLLTVELAASIIRRTPGWGVRDSPINDFLEHLLERLEGRQQMNICTVSLTAEGDLLSQWRGYCSPGDGMSIGLEFDRVQAIAASLGWTLAPCIYNKTEQLALLAAKVNEGITWLKSAPRHREPPGSAPGPIYQAAHNFAVQITELAPTLKDPSFEEEREWRLISPPQRFGDLWYRPGRHTIVPYKPFPLRHDGQDALATVEVKVGPTVHPELAQSAAGGALMAAKPKIPAYNVTRTETSYREW